MRECGLAAEPVIVAQRSVGADQIDALSTRVHQFLGELLLIYLS